MTNAREGARPASLDRVGDPPGREEAVQDHREPGALCVEDFKDLIAGAALTFGVAGVDDDRQVALAAISICASKARRWWRRHRRHHGSSRFRSPRSPAPSRARASRAISAAALLVNPAASLGWQPTLANTPSLRSAAAIASWLDSPPRPTFSIRLTPAARATSTSSASGRSQRNRWVWESINAPALDLREQGRDPLDLLAAAARTELRQGALSPPAAPPAQPPRSAAGRGRAAGW